MNNRTGELIEKYRKEKGLTQNELAKQLGVSNTAISKWEHGYNLPDIGLLEPLSKILGIDMLLLLSSENEDKEESNPVKQKSKRNRLIKVSLIILLFILSLTTINIFNYKHYQKELKTIKEELGMITDAKSSDYQRFSEKIASFKFEGEIKEAVESELTKFSLMDPNSSEFIVTRNYLETIVNLPWQDEGITPFDFTKANKILKSDNQNCR